MNVDEMFKESKKAAGRGTLYSIRDTGLGRAPDGSYYMPNGMSRRVYWILKRSGVDVDDVDAVENLVLSGAIFELRNMGDASVKHVCEWIVKQRSKS